MRLLIDPQKDHLILCVVSSGALILRGRVVYFTEAFSIQRAFGITEVLIDDGYRTHEVREAAAGYGWKTVRGPDAADIENKAHRDTPGGIVASGLVCLPADDRSLLVMLSKATTRLKRGRHPRASRAAISVFKSLGLLKEDRR